jgi:hypothetical protein
VGATTTSQPAAATTPANVRFLSAYRHGDRVDADLAAAIAGQAAGGVSVGELETAWSAPAGDVRATVLHLEWQGVFRADLSVPLSAATRLERAA